MTIVCVGDPVLRAVGVEVPSEAVGSDAVLALIRSLKEHLVETRGVGLAAPQIGLSQRVMRVQDLEEFHQPLTDEQLVELERQPITPYSLINPVVDPVGNERRLFFEGCLSVPGYRALVERSRTVRVRYIDDVGEPQDRVHSGWHARILQHEADHLDGRLFIDQMLSRTIVTEETYKALWVHRPVAEVLEAFGVNRTG